MDKCLKLIKGLNNLSTSYNILAAVLNDFTITDTTVLSALLSNNIVTS
jgi:hypothetical protein